MREALHSLTLRGRAFLAGGTTAVVCGILMGEHDLVRIGVLVLLLPLVTAAWVAHAGNRLGLVRTLSARQVEAGQPAGVRLELSNLGPTTGVLMVEEQLPYALGSRPRFVVDTMAPGWRRRIDYTVRSDVRGAYQIGPMRLRVGDPFGLIEVQRSFRQTSQLVVTPRVEPLPRIALRGAWAGSGDNRPRSFASGSAADVMVREYRLGDDLRRVHWRSTAHAGELMVRREEQPWQSRCTLFVDNRVRAHRGRGIGSSLESAVVATASIAVHLAGQGYQVRLVSATGEQLGAGWHDGGQAMDAHHLLERLAVLPAVEAGALVTDWVDDTVTSGMFLAVLGAFDDHDRAFFSRIHSPGGTPYALVLDVAGWAAPRRSDPAVLEPEAGSRTSWLQTHGWKATILGARVPLAGAWQELGR
ncbi:MAG TPA: DUF58 domain-containing protein [Marmoricola sp.]|jgi:uncharacterized protein (DUF58 family)